MKNKFKYLLLTILCFGAIEIPAQNGADHILVAGRPPLRQAEVGRMIEFYEWGFETTFSDAERRQYQAFLEKDYRSNAAGTRREIDDIVNTFVKIKAADEDLSRRTREAFIEVYVVELRNTAAAENSQFMLGIYENAQSRRSSAPPAEAPTTAAFTGGAIPQNLIGKWTRHTGTGGGRSHDGVTKYNSGEETGFEFFPNWTMQYSYEKSVLSLLQCRISQVDKIGGRYTVTGDALTMNLSAGSSVGSNSCDRQANFKKTLSASSLSHKFIVKKLESIFRPNAPLILCFDGQDDNLCFEKEVK